MPVAAWLCLAMVFGVCFPCLPAHAGRERLELRGRILTPDGQPLPGRQIVPVSLFGSSFSFVANTLAMGGHFKFSKLAPGSYTLAATVRGFGEVRQTVEVGRSLADRKGRVTVDISLGPLHPRTGTVSARELGIPPAAWEKFRRATGKLNHRDENGAIALLEQAVETTPNFVEALNLLGTIYYHKRDLPKAEEYFRQALAQDGNAYEPLVNLGGTLLSLDRPAEAFALNRNAVLARPDDALAHSQLGMNYFALGDISNAIVHLNLAKKLDPAHFSHPQMTLAEIYLRTGDRQAAAAELEEFVRLHPDDPNAAKIRAQLPWLRAR